MRKNFKRVTAAVLSAAMAFTLMPAMHTHANDNGDIFTATMKTYGEIFDEKQENQYEGKTVILHSNDVHGVIDGYAYIAELEDDFEDAGAEVITMDAGDYSQGDPNVSYSRAASAVELMNEAGYEFSTLGNHEFDYGYEQLKSNLKSANFKVLCADVLEGDKPIFDKDTIYTTKSGLKIGIFGMETPETESKTNPALIKGLRFLNNASGKTELYECAREEVKTLKDEGANIIVALTHLGMNKESKGDCHRSADLYKNVKGIDIMIDGHSHDVMTEGPEKETIQSTGTKFQYIGVVVIDDEKKEISDHYLVATKDLAKDEEVEKAAKNISDEVDRIYGTKIGESEIRFASEKAENRGHETNTGDLVTDAMVWKVLQDKTLPNISEDHITAMVNAGSIRAGLSVGDVSKKDILAILPYNNTLNVIYVKGSQILEALEASTFSLPDPIIAGYPQTNGIRFTVDTGKAYDKGELYEGSIYYKPGNIQRVSIESINGKAFQPDETYAVLTTDFCAAGGDTYGAFKNYDSRIETGFLLDEVVSDYIMEELGGLLSEDRYGKPRGDVTILKTSQEEPMIKLVEEPHKCLPKRN